MELWDLYDDERRPLGRTAVRGEMTAGSGLYHIVVMIITMNSRGQLLCTLRSPDKATYPNMWELTAGSAISGEDSFTAAKRELFEETGISVSDNEIRYVMTVKEASAFIDCYFVRRDIPAEDIVLQEGETVSAKWVGRTEFENMIAQKKIAFPVARRYGQLFGFLMAEGFL